MDSKFEVVDYDLLPFTTSTTSQLGSMLPMCLGCAGFTLPSKINAAEKTTRYHLKIHSDENCAFNMFFSDDGGHIKKN